VTISREIVAKRHTIVDYVFTEYGKR